MPNIGAQISSHSNKILGENTPLERGEWNCRVSTDCLIEGECISKNVLYEAVCLNFRHRKLQGKIHIGLTGTELSKEVWKIKERNGSFQIKWKILKQCHTYYIPTSNGCMLCASEKHEIALHQGKNLLNRRFPHADIAWSHGALI